MKRRESQFAARPGPTKQTAGAVRRKKKKKKKRASSCRIGYQLAVMPPRITLPPVTRILLVLLVLQSLLSAAIRYRQWTAHSEIVIPYLNLVPQLSLIYPWTFLTTTLVESNVFTLAIAALTLYHGGRYLERAWSSREFGKFLLITSLVPNALCFAVMILLFTFTRNERWTYVHSSGSFYSSPSGLFSLSGYPLPISVLSTNNHHPLNLGLLASPAPFLSRYLFSSHSASSSPRIQSPSSVASSPSESRASPFSTLVSSPSSP